MDDATNAHPLFSDSIWLVLFCRKDDANKQTSERPPAEQGGFLFVCHSSVLCSCVFLFCKEALLQKKLTSHALVQFFPASRVIIPSFDTSCWLWCKESAMPHHGSMQTKGASGAAQIPRYGKPPMFMVSPCLDALLFRDIVSDFRCFSTIASCANRLWLRYILRSSCRNSSGWVLILVYQLISLKGILDAEDKLKRIALFCLFVALQLKTGRCAVMVRQRKIHIPCKAMP